MYSNAKLVALLLSCIFLHEVHSEIFSSTLTIGVGVIASAFYSIKCHVSECCDPYSQWIQPNITSE